MPPATRRRILVIADDPSVLRGLERLIVAEGHLAVTVLNGRTALETIAGGDYDLILCDIGMPDLDGPGLYEEVERRWPHLVARFIFMTGVANRYVEGRSAVFERTQVHVMVKPFGREELLIAIRIADARDVESVAPMTDDAIRLKIRQLLEDGVLPREEARSVAVRHSRGGTTCVACGVAFTSEEFEYEVTTPRGMLLLLHRRCLELWAAGHIRG